MSVYMRERETTGHGCGNVSLSTYGETGTTDHVNLGLQKWANASWSKYFSHRHVVKIPVFIFLRLWLMFKVSPGHILASPNQKMKWRDTIDSWILEWRDPGLLPFPFLSHLQPGCHEHSSVTKHNSSYCALALRSKVPDVLQVPLKSPKSMWDRWFLVALCLLLVEVAPL